MPTSPDPRPPRRFPLLPALGLSLLAGGCATVSPTAGVGQVTSAPVGAPVYGRAAPVAPAPVASAPPPIILTPPVTAPTPPPVIALPSPPVPVLPTPEPVRPPLLALDVPKSLEQATTKPAVLALYRQSQGEQRAGQLDQAAATLERALRLDPRNGWLYQSLAQVNLAARRPDVAQGQAQKALSLSRRNPFLELFSLRTLEAAFGRIGNAAQAAAASARASLLESRIREAGGRV